MRLIGVIGIILMMLGALTASNNQSEFDKFPINLGLASGSGLVLTIVGMLLLFYAINLDSKPESECPECREKVKCHQKSK